MTPTAQLTATALFALLGAFFGAWLTRRSEYEKWYRQEKSNAFAEYLRQLHDARLRASDIYYGTDGTEQDRRYASGHPILTGAAGSSSR